MPTHAEMLDLREEWRKQLEQDQDPEKLCMRLAAMAHAMQSTLSLPSTRDAVPHAQALEVIMSGIARDIEDGATMRTYVREKINLGTSWLLAELN